jgi:hypothetical protein
VWPWASRVAAGKLYTAGELYAAGELCGSGELCRGGQAMWRWHQWGIWVVATAKGMTIYAPYTITGLEVSPVGLPRQARRKSLPKPSDRPKKKSLLVRTTEATFSVSGLQSAVTNYSHSTTARAAVIQKVCVGGAMERNYLLDRSL